MGNAVANFIQLGVFTTVSLFAACKIVGYAIPDWRKAASAGAFALVYSLPLGLIIHIAAPVALWFAMTDPEAEKKNRLPVLLLTYLFTAMLTLLFYQLTH